MLVCSFRKLWLVWARVEEVHLSLYVSVHIQLLLGRIDRLHGFTAHIAASIDVLVPHDSASLAHQAAHINADTPLALPHAPHKFFHNVVSIRFDKRPILVDCLRFCKPVRIHRHRFLVISAVAVHIVIVRIVDGVIRIAIGFNRRHRSIGLGRNVVITGLHNANHNVGLHIVEADLNRNVLLVSNVELPRNAGPIRNAHHVHIVDLNHVISADHGGSIHNFAHIVGLPHNVVLPRRVDLLHIAATLGDGLDTAQNVVLIDPILHTVGHAPHIVNVRIVASRVVLRVLHNAVLHIVRIVHHRVPPHNTVVHHVDPRAVLQDVEPSNAVVVLRLHIAAVPSVTEHSAVNCTALVDAIHTAIAVDGVVAISIAPHNAVQTGIHVILLTHSLNNAPQHTASPHNARHIHVVHVPALPDNAFIPSVVFSMLRLA